MLSTQKVLKLHEQGCYTSTDVMLNVLAQTSKSIVDEALPRLSPGTLEEMKRFVAYYTPSVQVFNGPRPRMPIVRYVKEWFAKAPACHWNEKVKPLRTLPILGHQEFHQLDLYSESLLSPKGYKRIPRIGSTSWADRLIKPRDNAVRFKLCNFPLGVFFGIREQWAKELMMPLERIGTVSEAASPFHVLFRGKYVSNCPEDQKFIAKLVELVP